MRAIDFVEKQRLNSNRCSGLNPDFVLNDLSGGTQTICSAMDQALISCVYEKHIYTYDFL